MSNTIEIQPLEQEAKALGILNIEVPGALTPADVKDALDAIKVINVNFKALATQAHKKMENPIK
jgi:hypothetical protein